MSVSKIWLRLNTRDGSERTATIRAPGRDEHGAEVVGVSCPCGVAPLRVVGAGRRRSTDPALARDTYEAEGVSACCGGHVGTIYAKVDTIFGIDEDEAVLTRGRARVY